MAHSQKQCIQVYDGANGSTVKVSNKKNAKFPNEVYWVFQDSNAPIQKISVDKSIFLYQDDSPVADGTVLSTTGGETDKVLKVNPNLTPGTKGIWSVPDPKTLHILFPAGGIIIEN